MSSHHLVDPELLAALELLPQFVLDDASLPAMRAARTAVATPDPDVAGVVIERRTITGEDGHAIGLILFRPEHAPALLPAMLHIHGGGYVMGAADMANGANAETAAAVGCLVVSVDYRLAPETRHPGPLEDCYSALRWLHGEAAALGVDPMRLAIAGESAGAGLAATLALLARDRGRLPIAFQCLTYPMLDDRTCAREVAPFVGEFVWTAESNRFGWQALLGCEPGGDNAPPYAAAARATDLSSLPPAFLAVGTLDLFLEENVEYARRLTRAGVPVELHVYPGAFHGFPLVPGTRLARTAERDRIDALKRILHGETRG